ncbi:putative sulfate exporter family transporter [halophilic archaeon]|nr:putative sulfate exporter family transporter [halophilic archaeon]
MTARTHARSLLPGLALLAGVAVVARTLGTRLAHLSPLIVAIAVGALVANTVGVPDWATPGVSRHKLLLETGIVLLGARLTVEELVTTGPLVVVLAAGAVVVGVLFTEAVAGRLLDVDGRTTSLLAAGASICGVSAVVAVAGSIDVDETDITYAVATILLFDAVTLVVFPILGSVLGITGKQFGIWAGLSLFSTGPTAAVGFAMSETAGRWATVTKLVRNSFIGLLAIAYAVRYTAGTGDSTGPTELWNRFPKFLLGFLAVIAIVNAVTLPTSTVAAIDVTGDWLFALAFAGLGFDLDLDSLGAAGMRPVALVVAHLATVSTLSLVAVVTLL